MVDASRPSEIPSVNTGGGGGAPMMREVFQAGYSAGPPRTGDIAMANLPRNVFAGDASVAAKAAPPPGDWHVSSTLPEVAANRPTLDSLKQGENPTVTVSQYDAKAAVQPDVLVKQDGSVEYAKGFTGNLANVNVAFEEGAKAEKVQSIVDATAGLQQESKDGVLPQLVDHSNGLLTKQFKDDFTENYSKPQKEPEGGGNGGGKRPDGGEDNNKGPDDNNDAGDDTVPSPNKKFDGKRQANELIAENAKSAGFFDGKVYGDKLMAAMPGGLQGMIDGIGHPPPFTAEEIAEYMKKHKDEIAKNLKSMTDEATAAGDKDGAAAITKLADDMNKPEFATGLAKAINNSGIKTEKKDGKDVLTPDSKFTLPKEFAQALLPHDSTKPAEDVVSAFNRMAMRQAAAKDPELTKLLEKESTGTDAEQKARAKEVNDKLQVLITKLKGKDAADLLK